MKQIDVKNIPVELREIPQWVLWKYQPRGENGKVSKPPCQPNGKLAKPNDPATWTTFDAVSNAFQSGTFEGIGFVLTAEDPYTGIDIDHCRDASSGELAEEAEKLVQAFNSYTEITPSEEGIRIWIRGSLPSDIKHSDIKHKVPFPSNNFPMMTIEVYDRKHYFTVTGKVQRGLTAIADGQNTLERVCREYLSWQPREFSPSSLPEVSTGMPAEDQALIARICKCPTGEKFKRLWEGGGGQDDSANDLALCNRLASLTKKDPARIDRLFRQSGLFRPKWDEVHYSNGDTYGEHTINLAVETCNGKKADESISQENPFIGKILTLQELYEQQPPDNWLAENLLCRGELFMLFGDSATGKTYLAIDLIYALATGEPWAGGKFPVPRPCTCVYAYAEGTRGILDRFKARELRYNESGGQHTANIYTVKLVPQLFTPDAGDGVYAFIEAVRKRFGEQEIDLVVIDTLVRSSLGADENNAKDASKIIAGAELIRQELGAAVLLVHHTNKDGGFRGSTALRGAVDGMLGVKKHGQHSFTLFCDKLKDADYFHPICFSFHKYVHPDSSVVEWDVCGIEGGTTLASRIVAALQEEYPRWLTAKELAEQLKKTQQQIGNAIKTIDKQIEKQLQDTQQSKSRYNPMIYRMEKMPVQQEE